MLIGVVAFLLIGIDPLFALASPVVALRSEDSVRSIKEGVFEGQVGSGVDLLCTLLILGQKVRAVWQVGVPRGGMRGAQNDYTAPMNKIRVDDIVKDDESDEVRCSFDRGNCGLISSFRNGQRSSTSREGADRMRWPNAQHVHMGGDPGEETQFLWKELET